MNKYFAVCIVLGLATVVMQALLLGKMDAARWRQEKILRVTQQFERIQSADLELNRKLQARLIGIDTTLEYRFDNWSKTMDSTLKKQTHDVLEEIGPNFHKLPVTSQPPAGGDNLTYPGSID